MTQYKIYVGDLQIGIAKSFSVKDSTLDIVHFDKSAMLNGFNSNANLKIAQTKPLQIKSDDGKIFENCWILSYTYAYDSNNSLIVEQMKVEVRT